MALKGRHLPPLLHTERSSSLFASNKEPCRYDVNRTYRSKSSKIYQEVFSYLIEEFKTYKPILFAIKNEYDVTLAHLRDQIHDLLPLKAKLVLVSETCDKKILEMRLQERDEIRALKKECQHLMHIIESLNEEQRALQVQINRLKEDLATQYQLYREERDARKLLITRISTMTFAHDSEQDDRNEEDESVDPVVLKMALQVCREDLTKAQAELNRIQAEYIEVVPRRNWDQLNQIHEETLKKLETLQTDFTQMKTEYDTLLELHHKPAHGGFYSNQSALQHGPDNKHIETTPRPNWDQCSDVLGGNGHFKELFEGQSSQRKLEILLQEINGKNELSGLNGESRDLQTFMRSYLEEQYKDKAGDWAYSLMDSIQNNLKDDLICLFYDILTKKVDESVYHGQTLLLSHLLKVFIQSDTKQSGSLTISEFSEALKKAFPLKTDEDIEELLKDADGGHKEFLNLVKKQASAEKLKYIEELKVQLDGKREVNAEQLSAAFKAIDPSLDPENLKWNLCVAFQTKECEVQAQAVDTEVVLQRLSVTFCCQSKMMTLALRMRKLKRPLKFCSPRGGWNRHSWNRGFGLGLTEIDASCLTWEGQQFQGKAAIVEKLSSLPFTKIAHSITAQDHQPTPDSCILSMVVGQLKADDDPIMGFHQSFILKNINDAWVCTNDMFRLALHNFG
ncbi:hypothetical protein DNTS_005017 [Danionella cerebrum]|uniref:Nuclear transport factor 2 n=1 Tax=Danionella cerebrum TaxID=2873325 RepID=A0A553Q9R3_9TELE|nr:hypothetical protein DNTS_005017 [Danionella translucida]